VVDATLSPDDLEQTMLAVLDDALVGEGLISSYDDLEVQRNETGDAVASSFSMTSDIVDDGEGGLVLLQNGQTVYTLIFLTPDYDALEPVWETATDTLLVTSVEAEAPPDTPAEPTDTPVPPTAKPTSLKSYFVVYTNYQGPDLQNYSLWGMNGDGSGVFEVTGAGQASEPAFSPDGTKFAFYHWTDGLYVWNLAKETSTRIVDNSEASFPSWAPKGNRLAYANLYGQPAIHIVNSDGGGDRKLTPGLRPSWSLNGGCIAYDTCENNKCGIFRINPDGGGKRQLTSDGGGGSAVSPNGKQIAYWSRADGDFEIYIVNADGGGKKQLTKNSGNDALPAWSPDGKYIYYLSDQNGKGWAVMVMNANGSNQRMIAKANAGNDPVRGWQYQRITVTWNN
jgi:Tol biopolymer transport system component